jgi:hypothetical protein
MTDQPLEDREDAEPDQTEKPESENEDESEQSLPGE